MLYFPLLYSDLFGMLGKDSVFHWPLRHQNVIFRTGQQSSTGSLGRKNHLKSSAPTHRDAECMHVRLQRLWPVSGIRNVTGQREWQLETLPVTLHSTASFRTSTNQILHFILKHIHWNFETEIFKLHSCCFTRAVLPWTYGCIHFQTEWETKWGWRD